MRLFGKITDIFMNFELKSYVILEVCNYSEIDFDLPFEK